MIPFQSADPFQKPTINVNYFAADFDLDVQVAGAKLSRTVLNTSPLRCVSFHLFFVIPPILPRTPHHPIPSPYNTAHLAHPHSLTDLTPSDLSVGETIPGPDVANNASDEDWASWVKNGFSSVHHPIATCAMMKRELGGKSYYLH